jgi:hypothetical protein
VPRSQRVMPLKVNLAHQALDAFRVAIDLGHVLLPQDPAAHVLRGGRAAAAQELHELQGLVGVDHAHAPRDGVAQALLGGGGGWGHGILALRGPVLGLGVTGGGTDLM